jgi:MoxR-like ATPase
VAIPERKWQRQRPNGRQGALLVSRAALEVYDLPIQPKRQGKCAAGPSSPFSAAMTESIDFEQFSGTDGYIASSSLLDAVNAAIALQRPLLIKGEPGTGKTLLAEHVAEALGQPLEKWHIKSTSKAQEGLYVYDTVQRLNDARFGDGDVSDIRAYIRMGAMGRAFAAEKPHILLIDEIDKADIEFPNDLLRELDEMRFTVMETGDEVVAEQRPLVIITSNNERELPDAFLRRCVFHFIEFPDKELMTQIVAVHHPHLETALLDQVLVKFFWLREQTELRKKPSTSELIDWISVLLRSGMTADDIEQHIPFLGALLKNEQDTEALDQYAERGGSYPSEWSDLGPRYNN